MRTTLLPIVVSACLALIASFPTNGRCDAPVVQGVWDIAATQRTTLPLALELVESGLVYVGEHHDNYLHHLAQFEVIRTLHEQGREVAVGLEMMQQEEQPMLDAWVAGKVTERTMRKVFARNWNDTWELYAPIFLYCRDNGLAMVGLNVDRAITRKVYREGFASLTDEEIGALPPIMCDVSPEYRAFLEAVLGGHSEGEAFDNFCEAQLVWDTAMAVYATEYLKTRPATVMVVITGMVHAWKMAMPRRAAEQFLGVPQIVMQPRIPGRWDEETTTVQDADYLLYVAD